MQSDNETKEKMHEKSTHKRTVHESLHKKPVFELHPMEKTALRERIRHDQALRRIFRKKPDLSQQINDDIQSRLHNSEKNWVLVQVNGEPGSKKSSIGLTIAKHIDPGFTAAQVAHEYTDFEEKIKNSKPGQAFVLDEMVFQHGTGSVRMVQNIINLSETLRKRQNHMIFITPTQKFILDDNVNFTLEPMGFDREQKMVRCLVKKNRPLGFAYIPLDWNSQLWEDYELLKDEFIERTANQAYKGLDLERIAQKIISTAEPQYLENKKTIKLLVAKQPLNLTIAEKNLVEAEILMQLSQGSIEEEPPEEPPKSPSSSQDHYDEAEQEKPIEDPETTPR